MDFDVVLLAFHSYKNMVTAILSLCRCRAAAVFFAPPFGVGSVPRKRGIEQPRAAWIEGGHMEAAFLSKYIKMRFELCPYISLYVPCQETLNNYIPNHKWVFKFSTMGFMGSESLRQQRCAYSTDGHPPHDFSRGPSQGHSSFSCPFKASTGRVKPQDSPCQGITLGEQGI